MRSLVASGESALNACCVAHRIPTRAIPAASRTMPPPVGLILQPRIHRLALEGQDAEHALVHAAERLLPDESLEPLDAEGEFAQGQGALDAQATRAQSLDVLREGVLETVDDAQVLGPA